MAPRPTIPRPDGRPFGEAGKSGRFGELAGMGIWLLRAAALLLVLIGLYEMQTFFAYWLHRVEPPSFDWSRDPLPNYMAVRHSFLMGYPLVMAGVMIIVFSLGSAKRRPE